MASLSSRALFLAAFAGCTLLSLRPVPAVERALDGALSPLRLLSEVAWPVGLLRARSVRAAERRAGELYLEEQAARRALGADQRRFVLPHEEALRRGRDFVVGEVVGRLEDDVDRLQVRVFSAGGARAAGIAAGQPVVVGDHYVGRVHGLAGELVLVDLVIASDGFVGALTGTGEARSRLVVGGLRPRSRGSSQLDLAVHSPELARLEPGPVRVDETLSKSPHAALASGFLIGDLVAIEGRGEAPSYAVRSPIDFVAGIFQVAIVRAASSGGGSERSGPQDPLEDSYWTPARALTCGDPLPLREGVVLDSGRLAGARAGAAVVAGARLVGRVERTSLFSCFARLVGDPGLTLPVVARIDGRQEPLILGSLVSLGRADGREGPTRVRFHWESGWTAEGAEAGGVEDVTADLFTGAGAAGVPPGLVLGHARLARRAGPQVIEIELAVDPRELGRVRVRLPEESDAGTLGEAP